MVPIRVAWRLGRQGRGEPEDADADYPPADDLSQSILELAASVAVETVDAVKRRLFASFVQSFRRDPTGGSVLRDCGLALDEAPPS